MKMDRKEYITRLKNNLQILNPEEFEDAIAYVEEYFNEAGVENEQQVIEELGPPAKYAAQIKAEASIKQNCDARYKNYKKQSNIQTVWIIIAGICALPIALPLLIVILALLFTLLVLVFTLVFVAFILTIAFFVVSIPLLFSAFPILATSFGDGLIALGVSLGLLGCSIIGAVAFIVIITHFIPWFVRGIGRLFHRLKGDRKNEKTI